jgi:hypothetical protein
MWVRLGHLSPIPSEVDKDNITRCPANAAVPHHSGSFEKTTGARSLGTPKPCFGDRRSTCSRTESHMLKDGSIADH